MVRGTIKLTGLVLIWTVVLATIVLAWPQGGSVEGTYDVTAVGNDVGTIKFLMVLKRDGGKWAGEFKDSPTPLDVTSVTVDAENNITVLAKAGDAVVTISGKYNDGKIEGNWSAGEAKGTWSAVKQSGEMKSSASAASPGAAASGELEGTYDMQVTAEGQGSLPLTLVIKRNGDKLTTEVPGGGDLNIVDIKVEGDNVTLSASFQGGNPFPLPGKRSGSEMSGKWEAGGFSGTWSAKKKTGN